MRDHTVRTKQDPQTRTRSSLPPYIQTESPYRELRYKRRSNMVCPGFKFRTRRREMRAAMRAEYEKGTADCYQKRCMNATRYGAPPPHRSHAHFMEHSAGALVNGREVSLPSAILRIKYDSTADALFPMGSQFHWNTPQLTSTERGLHCSAEMPSAVSRPSAGETLPRLSIFGCTSTVVRIRVVLWRSSFEAPDVVMFMTASPG